MGSIAQEREARASTVRVVALFIAGLAASAEPLTGQEAIELPLEDRPLDASFEELYRLGSLDGGSWDTFGDVASLGFDGDGNLYVLDAGAVRIYVVDLQGNLARQFIGEGQGPGEFGRDYAASLQIAVMRDGRVAVFDTGRMGFGLFSADGEFQRTIPLGSRGQFALIRGLQAFPGVDRVLATTEVSYLGGTEPEPDDEAQAPPKRRIR